MTTMTQEELLALPEYVQTLIVKTQGFEDLFLRWNPKYLTKHFLDYLPDFEKKEDGGKPYWVGKMKWRFVGWENNIRYTGTDLRKLRRQKGVGNYKKLDKYAEEKYSESLSG